MNLCPSESYYITSGMTYFSPGNKESYSAYITRAEGFKANVTGGEHLSPITLERQPIERPLNDKSAQQSAASLRQDGAVAEEDPFCCYSLQKVFCALFSSCTNCRKK